MFSSAVLAAGVSNQHCLTQASGLLNPTCNASDTQIQGIKLIGTPQTCNSGNLVQVQVEITVVSLLARYDIGLWINQRGGSANTAATAQCFREILTPVGTGSSCNNAPSSPGSGVYYNADGDACGDVYAPATDPCGTKILADCGTGMPDDRGNCVLTRIAAELEVACTDVNGDLTVDTGVCASWESNIETSCSSAQDAVPDTNSRCSCSDGVAITNLFYTVPAEEIFLDGFEAASLLMVE